jgi:hypothetical protein
MYIILLHILLHHTEELFYLSEYLTNLNKLHCYFIYHIPLGFYLARVIFDPENAGSMFFQDTGKLLPDYTVSHHRKQFSF